VLSFSPVVSIGTPPTPNPQASVPAPPPLVLGVGAHSLVRLGVGHILWYSIYVCTLWREGYRDLTVVYYEVN
jgi:hypothetical protein